MNRINVFDYDTIEPEFGEYGPRDITLVGWFDLDKAEIFNEESRWNGNNHISVNTNSQWNHVELIRSAGGRWIKYSWSQWQGTLPRHEFVTEQEAKDWLILNEHDDIIEKYFGELPEEEGPSVGRPEIGPTINIRLTPETLDQVDQLAKVKNTSRAAMIRGLVETALNQVA